MKIPAIYFAALALLSASATAQSLESIKVGDVTYRNPTIRQEFPRSILINHDEGMAFVERENLSPEDLAKLSASPEAEDPKNAATEENKEAKTPPDASAVTEQETVVEQETESSETADDATTTTGEGESETSTAEAPAPSPEPAPESSAEE